MDDTVSHVVGVPVSAVNRDFAASLGVAATIHPEDFIFHFVAQKWTEEPERGAANYFELGHYSARLAREMVDEVIRIRAVLNEPWQPRRLLDFASGYGCVARHLPRAFPETAITTCDIHAQAVSFNAAVLDLESHLSSTVPEQLAVPEQDVIIALSFFSHMPNATFTRWLQALAARLAPRGVLIFTANGHVTEALGVTGLTAAENGFAFRPESEQRDLDGGQYGITLSHPRWVFRAIEQCPGLRLSRFQEGHWWAIQDTYVCTRI